MNLGSVGLSACQTRGCECSGAGEHARQPIEPSIMAGSVAAGTLRTSATSATVPYFEQQEGAWCGMHVLHNYLGGPFVNKDACRRAAGEVSAMLPQGANGDAEATGHHIDPATGFLSIEVINVLGASNLGLRVDEAPISWGRLRRAGEKAALVNWNKTHWTVLHFEEKARR